MAERYYMNKMFGAGMERERAKSEGREHGEGAGGGKHVHLEIHAEPGKSSVHVHRGGESQVGQGPSATGISDDKPEVNEFPDHAKMMEFVHKLTSEAMGAPIHAGKPSGGTRGEKAEGFDGKHGESEHTPSVDGAGI